MNQLIPKSKSQFIFERFIEVLVVDDEPSHLYISFENLSRYKLYNVTCAYSAREADSILSSSKRFHVCLMDLGLTDVDGDEYFLIKKYSPKVTFIVVTARASVEVGFQANVCGAIAAMNKPIDYEKTDIFNLINEAFFRSLIVPEDMSKCKPIVKDAIKSLLAKKPATIQQWADKVGIDERYLRRVWLECYDYNPRYILWLNKIFQHIFAYNNTQYCKNIGMELNGDEKYGKENIEYISNRFTACYTDHKREIDRILWRDKLID